MADRNNIRFYNLFMLGFLSILSGCSTAISTNQLYVLHAPRSLKFVKDAGDIPASEIHKLISTSLGLAPANNMKWQGLLQGSLFSRPKANVLLTIAGYPADGEKLNLKSIARYNIENDLPYIDLDPLSESLHSTFQGAQPLLVDLALDRNIVGLKSAHPDLFQTLPGTVQQMTSRLLEDELSILHHLDVGSLNASLADDIVLLAELQLIKDVFTKVSEHKEIMISKTPDMFTFTITGVRSLVDKYGKASEKFRHALKLLNEFFEQLSIDLQSLYKSNVIVEVITMENMQSEPKLRVARSLKAEAVQASKNTSLNLAADVDADYPIILNISVWMMIILAISVFVTSYCLWYMDPGRDSIIYRMTSQRMKKDN